MLASFAILLAGMIGIGAWVERQIELGVIHRTGVTTALYVDSFVAPNLQELGESDELSPDHVQNLGNLLQDTPLGQQIVEFKVWNTRGKLLYSTVTSTIGKIYPMHEGMLRARLGEVVSEVSTLDEAENAELGKKHTQLLETYSPVWLSGTNQIIAVAEFYQMTDELENEIATLVRRSRLVVGAAIAVIYLLLSGFVRRVSRTISQQQTQLADKVEELTDLLAQNRKLHARVKRASGSVAMLNENYLRRISAEIHDGPTQVVGLSILKLDSTMGKIEERANEDGSGEILDELYNIENDLQNALKELRGIASGLSMPQLAKLDLSETVLRAIRAHERRTKTHVALDLDDIFEPTPLPIKITVYRLIQEALNNAYRHAGGESQQVCVTIEEGTMVIEISDRGPGFDPKNVTEQNERLGLSGMRERVESLGGVFYIESHIGQGTRVLAYLPVQTEGDDAP